MFCPVPARIARWSPNRSGGSAPWIRDWSLAARRGGRRGPLLEVSEPTEVLLDLLRLGLVQPGGEPFALAAGGRRCLTGPAGGGLFPHPPEHRSGMRHPGPPPPR